MKIIKCHECFNDFDKGQEYLKFTDELCKVDMCNIYGFNMPYNDDKINICGFPGVSGSSSYILPQVCFSISEACEYKEQAWSFIKKYFTAQYQKDIVVNTKGGCFPVRKDAYEVMFNISSSENDSNGLLDEIDTAVKSADKAILNNKSINNIILQEVSAYFDGDDSPENVASSIQNKVKLFMNEIS